MHIVEIICNIVIGPTINDPIRVGGVSRSIVSHLWVVWFGNVWKVARNMSIFWENLETWIRIIATIIEAFRFSSTSIWLMWIRGWIGKPDDYVGKRPTCLKFLWAMSAVETWISTWDSRQIYLSWASRWLWSYSKWKVFHEYEWMQQHHDIQTQRHWEHRGWDHHLKFFY